MSVNLELLIICATAIIITLFIYLLFKDKNDGAVEWDTKTGKLTLKKSSKKVVDSRQREIDDIVDYYNNFKPNKNIEKIESYKEFCFSIVSSTILIYKDILKFLRRNNITDMNKTEFSKYATEKISFASDTYNAYFKKSKNELVKIQTVQDILGAYKTVCKQMAKDFFNTVYDNHYNLNKKRKEYILEINEKTDNQAEKLSLLYSLMFKDLNECLDNDEALLYNLILEINNVLIGLWHDVLLDYINEVKK